MSSDTPFGFSNPDDDPDRKKEGEGSSGGESGAGNPFAFGLPGGGGTDVGEPNPRSHVLRP